jgi:competence protein ComFB
MALPWEVDEGQSEKAPSAMNNYRRSVVNVTELIAETLVDEVITMMGSCSCSKCVDDVLAIALNSLPTKYVTTDVGKQYIQLNSYKKQFETDVVSALIKACQIVKNLRGTTPEKCKF